MPLELRIAYTEARRAKAARKAQRAAIAAVRLHMQIHRYLCMHISGARRSLPRISSDATGAANCVPGSQAGQGCSAARRNCRGAYIYYRICVYICIYTPPPPPPRCRWICKLRIHKQSGPRLLEKRSAPLLPRCVYILLHMFVYMYVSGMYPPPVCQ